MNEWLWAGAAMVGLLIPCGLLALRGGIADRVLALELGGGIATVAVVVLSEGFGRSIYFDLALVYGVASFVTSLVIVRFLERWV